MNTLPLLVEWIPGLVRQQQGFRLMVVLAAPGCSYARKLGGCSNCGFAAQFGTHHPVMGTELLAQVQAALERIPRDVRSPVEIDLFCSGSFLNPEEISTPDQRQVLSLAAAHPLVSSILIESRPEYVTSDALDQAVLAVAGKPLEVAIGLESSNEIIREQKIRKGFTWEQFAMAAELISSKHVELLVYVLLKPMDTTEAEAIEDSVTTILQVFELGKRIHCHTRIALEPCFVAPNTRLFQVFKQGSYRPPWLWSVLEVLRRTKGLGPIVVGLSDEGLQPEQSPHNCARCSRRIQRELSIFNCTQEFAPLASLHCNCKAEWRAILQV